MNRVEQKERLVELIELIENSIAGLENISDDLDDYANEYESMYSRLLGDGYSASDIMDEPEEYKAKLLKQMLENNADLSTIEDNLDSFKSELDDYAYDLPPSRQEKLEERYSDWDDITSKVYDLQNDDELTIEGAKELMQEIIEILKGYKKGR